MSPIYRADAILKPREELLALPDLIGDRRVLCWELDMIVIDFW